MSQLPLTKLETHETGATGLNAIVNGNWERLEELFTPGLTVGDSGFHAFGKALLRDTMATMANGETIVYTPSGWKRRKPVATVTYAASLTLAFASGQAAPVQLLTLTGDVTITATNMVAGQEMRVRVAGGASSRTLAFDASWKWLGAKPATLAANKTGLLKLISTTTANSGMIAEWSVET